MLFLEKAFSFYLEASQLQLLLEGVFFLPRGFVVQITFVVLSGSGPYPCPIVVNML